MLNVREVPVRPWLVMVTGEPGSGKTSLGLRLAAELRAPFLSRDAVRGGLLATAGLWTNQLHDPSPREAAVETLVEVVESMARRGVTLVLEFVVTPSRLDALRRLEKAANCLVILTIASDSRARAARRDRNDPFLSRPDVLVALGHQSIDDYIDAPERDVIRTSMQSEFDLPLLQVSTDHGYEPDFEVILEWIIDQTRR